MWTAERVELLRKLWGEGLSASQIAAHIEGATRNSVIGKRNRLGLPKRTNERTRGDAIVRKIAKARKAKPPQFKKEPIKVAPEPEGHSRVTLSELRPHHCRWPIGDPKESTFRYCGERKHSNSYCSHHAGRAKRVA